MKDHVRDGVLRSFRRLEDEDGCLFDCEFDKHDRHARKLHEVCINHQLAKHLEAELIPVPKIDEELFVDIEFNREGGILKTVQMNGKDETVRPDIIIHNRRSGKEKLNFLVVECKKQGAPIKHISVDCNKINAFMEDDKYKYSYGLTVLYGKDGVKGKLFYWKGNRIEQDELDPSKDRQPTK